MHKVTPSEFYSVMNPLNVIATITNDKWPYTTDWYLANDPARRPIGRSEGRRRYGADGSLYDYFLTADRLPRRTDGLDVDRDRFVAALE